jgi:hypothetical protein
MPNKIIELPEGYRNYFNVVFDFIFFDFTKRLI